MNFFLVNTNFGDMMITRHEIKDDTLYIHLSFDYEIGSDFLNGLKNNNIIDKLKEYINNMKINFNGKKIVLVIGGIALVTLFFNNSQVKLDDNIYSSNNIVNYIVTVDENVIKEKEVVNNEIENNGKDVIEASSSPKKTNVNPAVNIPSETKQMVTIIRSNGAVTLELEEYVVGVVGAEMPASFHPEALKVQAIIARTYALNRIENNLKLTDKSDTQNYKDDHQLRSMWGNNYNTYIEKVRSAVASTKGQTIKYNNKYIEALYHSTSNLQTEDSVNVWGNNLPYLKSVESNHDNTNPSFVKTELKEINMILNILGLTELNNGDIEVLSKTTGNRVQQIRIKDKVYSGVDLRNILGLRSTDFDLKIENGNLVITTKGYGHGVGLSQYGANGMAKAGSNYEQIIKHYYTGVNISN